MPPMETTVATIAVVHARPLKGRCVRCAETIHDRMNEYRLVWRSSAGFEVPPGGVNSLDVPTIFVVPMSLEGELDVEVGLSDKELPLLIDDIVAAGAELPSCAELALCAAEVPLPPL
jgi:hypothetical protein